MNPQGSPQRPSHSGVPTSIYDHRGLPESYPFKPEFEWTPRETFDRLRKKDGSFQLIDCRTTEEWDLVRIPGAVNIPLHELESRLDELEPGKRPVFLCHHGVRSLKAALAARAHGFKDAMSVAGGIELWSMSADSSVPRYERGPGVLKLLD